MKEKRVQYFTDTEEEFVSLLIEIGIRKNVAKLLVFFANTPSATSREIERGTDLRQPEVSMAVKQLADKGWIKERNNHSENKGRPEKNYSLAVPVEKIIAAIEKAKKNEIHNQLELVRKIRKCI